MGSDLEAPDPWGSAWFTDAASGATISGRQVPLGPLAESLGASVPDARPWHLVVQFTQRYPDEACPFAAACRGRKHLIYNPRHMFYNSLKEGLFMLTGARARSSQLRRGGRRPHVWYTCVGLPSSLGMSIERSLRRFGYLRSACCPGVLAKGRVLCLLPWYVAHAGMPGAVCPTGARCCAQAASRM